MASYTGEGNTETINLGWDMILILTDSSKKIIMVIII